MRKREGDTQRNSKETESSKEQLERCIKRERKTDVNIFKHLDMKKQNKIVRENRMI